MRAGIALSDSLRDELRLLEDGLDHDVQSLAEHEARTSQLAFWAAVGGPVIILCDAQDPAPCAQPVVGERLGADL